MIIHYSLVYTENEVGGLSTDPFLITDTMFTVEGLNRYTEYSFNITAATSAGIGPSAGTADRTAEDGKYEFSIQSHYVNL